MRYGFLLGVFLIPWVCFARWASPEDAGWELIQDNREIEVEPDGSYSEIIETRKRVLKDSARGALSVARQVYNSNIARLKVIEAKTIRDGVEYPVDLSSIEDKPLASSPNGFDKLNQVLIAFPEVSTRSEIYLKLELRQKEVPIPGFFSADFAFGWEGVFQSGGKIRISSQIPLNLAKNDPDEALAIEQRHEDGRSEIQIKLKRPVFKKAVDESSVYLSLKNYPWVTVSSVKNWTEVADQLVSRYEAVLAKPLPGVFGNIVKTAAAKKTPVDRINVVTAGVDALINYMGDWKTTSGRYVPRALETIAETRFGDCKDFSAVTVAILRKLGYQAHVALIKRGAGAMAKPTPLPSLYDFNHAIVHVKAEEREYWVDPTNFASFAQGIFPDIADRSAWVLSREGPFVGRTTSPRPEDEQSLYFASIQIGKERFARFEANLQLRGAAAIRMTGALLKSSRKSVDYSLVNYFADRGQLRDWAVEPYDLSSRVVSDLDFKFWFTEKRFKRMTSDGAAFDLSWNGPLNSPVLLFLTKVEERVSDLFFGSPSVFRRKIRLDSVARVGNKSLDCSIRSPWMSASRKVSESRGGVEISDDITVHKGFVPNQELRTPAFASFQERLSHCFWRVSVLYRESRGREIGRKRKIGSVSGKLGGKTGGNSGRSLPQGIGSLEAPRPSLETEAGSN